MKKLVLLLFVFGIMGIASCSKKEDPIEPKKETVSLEIQNLNKLSSTDLKVVFGMPANMVELKTSKRIGN